MAQLIPVGDELVLTLTAAEKAEVARGDLRIPMSSVRNVEVVENGLKAVRGVRWWAGLFTPGFNAVGMFHDHGKKTFAVVHHGTRRAVRVTLDAAECDELIVGCEDPEAIADQIFGHL